MNINSSVYLNVIVGVLAMGIFYLIYRQMSEMRKQIQIQKNRIRKLQDQVLHGVLGPDIGGGQRTLGYPVGMRMDDEERSDDDYDLRNMKDREESDNYEKMPPIPDEFEDAASESNSDSDLIVQDGSISSDNEEDIDDMSTFRAPFNRQYQEEEALVESVDDDQDQDQNLESEDKQTEVEDSQPEVEDSQPKAEDSQPELEEVQPKVEGNQPELEEDSQPKEEEVQVQLKEDDIKPEEVKDDLPVVNEKKSPLKLNVKPKRKYKTRVKAKSDSGSDMEDIQSEGSKPVLVLHVKQKNS